jgi:hypothetical protein
MALPSQEKLQELLDYDPETGIAIWRSRAGTDRYTNRFNRHYAGKVAGGCKGGKYLWVSIQNENFMLHRVIFKLMTGYDPELVDHINGDKHDNRWLNLREASPSQNRCNTAVTKRSLSGIKGVRQAPSGKWQGIVTKTQKVYRTKLYVTAEEAKAELEHIRLQIHGEFAKQ